MARPRQVSDEELLSTARALFIEYGPSCSTQIIADEVGLSQAALFKRFGTKQALLLASLAPPREISWITAAEAGPGPGPLRDELEALLRHIDTFLSEFAPCIAVLASSGIDPRPLIATFGEPPPKRGHRALRSWLKAAIDQGRIRPVDTASVATLLMGAIQSRVMLGHLFGIETSEGDHVATVLTTVWDGIRPEDS